MYGLCCLILLAIVLRVLLPLGVKIGLRYALERSLNRTIELADVDLWLWRGRVALEGLAIGDGLTTGTDGHVGLAQIRQFRSQRLWAQIEWMQLFRRRLCLRQVGIDTPVVHLTDVGSDNAQNQVTANTSTPDRPNGVDARSTWPVQINALTVRQADIQIVDAGAPTSLSVQQLDVRDVKYLSDQWSVGQIDLRAPRVRMHQALVKNGPGQGAPDRSATRSSPDSDRSEPSSAIHSNPIGRPQNTDRLNSRLKPVLDVGRLTVTEGQFSIGTDSSAIEFRIDAEGSRFTTASQRSGQVRIDVKFRDGEFHLDGHLSLAPLTFRGHVNWDRIALAPLAGLVPGPLENWLTSCQTQGDLTVAVTGDESSPNGAGSQVMLAGQVGVDDFMLAEPESDEFICSWKRLDVTVDRLAVSLAGSAPMQVAIESIRLADPVLKHTRPSDKLESLFDAQQSRSAEHDQPQRRVDLTVGQINLTGGSIQYTDHTFAPVFHTQASGLTVSAKQLCWPQLQARDIEIEGIAADNASFKATGSVEPGSGKVTLDIDHLDLTSFNTLSTHFTGYQIDGGQLSLSCTVEHPEPDWKIAGKLVLHHVTFTADAQRERTIRLPSDLEMAVLRDIDGDIKLPVAVTLSERRSETQLGPIIVSAIQHAFLGALTSPLKAIGALVSADDGGKMIVEPIPLAAGANQVGSGQNDRLTKLASLLVSRPTLGFRLRGRAGPDDRVHLAHQVLGELLAAGKPLPEIDSFEWFASLRVERALAAHRRGEGAKVSRGDQALLRRYTDAVQITTERYDQLAGQRAQAVLDHLVNRYEVNPKKVTTGDPSDPGPPAVLVEIIIVAPR